MLMTVAAQPKQATPVAHVVTLAFATWLVCNLIGIAVDNIWPYDHAYVHWFGEFAHAIRFACALVVAAAVVFVALGTATRHRRVALLVAGSALLAGLLLRGSMLGYRTFGHMTIETMIVGFRVEFALRVLGLVALAIAVWPRARVAVAVALVTQSYFLLDVFQVEWLKNFRFSSTGEWFGNAVGMTCLLAMAVMTRAAAGDLRCDSEPHVRRSYHVLAIAMGLRVGLAAVVAFGVLLGSGNGNGNGNGSALLRWLLPLSLGGAWLINLLMLVAVARLVFAATGESLRVVMAAVMLICAAVLQIPMLGALWQAWQGDGGKVNFQAVSRFQYALPLLTLLGTWGLISVVYRVANQRGQNEVAESTFASGVMFVIVSVAGFASQLALSEVRTRGQALAALAISVGCGLAAVVLLLRLFQRARDALPAPTELPAAIVRPT